MVLVKIFRRNWGRKVCLLLLWINIKLLEIDNKLLFHLNCWLKNLRVVLLKMRIVAKIQLDLDLIRW